VRNQLGSTASCTSDVHLARWSPRPFTRPILEKRVVAFWIRDADGEPGFDRCDETDDPSTPPDPAAEVPKIVPELVKFLTLFGSLADEERPPAPSLTNCRSRSEIVEPLMRGRFVYRILRLLPSRRHPDSKPIGQGS